MSKIVKNVGDVHTSSLNNEKNKIKERHICAKASNFSVQNNNAITLIALVITIIVLLILAGVTLSMVMGDSGIFTKANQAKEQTQLANAKEIIKLAVLENEVKKYPTKQSDYKEEAELKTEIEDKLKEEGYKVKDGKITIGKTELDIAEEIKKVSTGETDSGDKTERISAQEIYNNPEEYYGKEVNYTSANGQNDWKIFHSDGTNIYLITGNYVKVTGSDNATIDTKKLNANTKMQIVSGAQNYRVQWNSSNLPSFSTDVSTEVISKFKINTSVFNINNYKSNANAQCVSTLLDTNNWTGYIDTSKSSGQYAIGGPTVELWMESWNRRYPSASDQLYCNNSNSYGYYVGTESNPKNYGSNTTGKKGEGGELYFANNHSALTDGDNTVNYYYLASPSAYSTNRVLGASYDGYVGRTIYDYYYGGLRPVVCLQSNITLK